MSHQEGSPDCQLLYVLLLPAAGMGSAGLNSPCPLGQMGIPSVVTDRRPLWP